MTVDMLDVTHSSLGNVPHKLNIKRAGYTTGSPDIRWTGEDWKSNPDATVHIDQSDSVFPNSGNVKDIENGASTIPVAVEWAKRRAALHLDSTFYISSANLEAAEAAVREAGLASWVTYWIADWNLSREEAIAELGGRIVAIQYASPTSNPRSVIPGTKITLSQANVDLSVTVDGWHPTPIRHRKISVIHIHKPKPIHRKVKTGSSSGALTTGIIALVNHVFHAHLTATEGAAIATVVASMVAYYTPSA